MCQQWDLRRDEVEASSLRADPRKHWSLFKSLSGKNSRPPPNQPISFKGKTHTKASAIARGFGRLFTSAAPHKSNKCARKVKRSLFSRHKLDPSFAPFSTADTLSAINAAKSSSAVQPYCHPPQKPRSQGTLVSHKALQSVCQQCGPSSHLEGCSIHPGPEAG